jgi:tetratricopeptide (TPR) repeat protein
MPRSADRTQEAIEERVAAAIRLHNAGERDAAEAAYRGILSQFPRHFDATHLLGVVQWQKGDLAEARRLIGHALTLGQSPAAYLNLGHVEAALGDKDAAIALYEKALALDPNLAAAHAACGNAAYELGRYDVALGHLEGALALQPHWPEALNNKGNILRNLRRCEEAIAAYDVALVQRPAHASTLYNRILALRDLDRLTDALADCEQIVALQANDPMGHNERGTVLADIGRHLEAIACFKTAIALDAGYADAHWNLALAYLVTGQFEKGWPEYEWRWRKTGVRPAARAFAQAIWTGQEPLAGKTILLHGEQGFGDTIQFCRYAPMVRARGGRVLLEAPAALLPLLESLDGADQLIGSGDPLPAFDYHCPLLSLPNAFQTRGESIPAVIPYMGANAERVSFWESCLGPKSALRVGIVWAGSAGHSNDRRRSLPLATLLQGIPNGVEVIGLQKDIRDQDHAVLRARPDVRNLGSRIGDFADTAALVSLMDVVVSVDTSVVHLAGALGKPTWLLLAAIHDWRWLVGRNDSPWYPTLRIFRQQTPGDWLPVVTAVKEALKSRTNP